MGLGRNPGLQGHIDGREHGLLVMLEDERQNVDHLAITARLFEQVLLQYYESFRKLDKRRTIAKSTWFALNDGEIVPPAVNRPPRTIMRTADDATVLAYDQAFCCNSDTIWVNPNADRPIGKGCRNAVAMTIKVHEAGRGNPLGMFDKSIEDTCCWHESLRFLGP